MDGEKHPKALTEILSPSKITDYFCSKTAVQNGNDFLEGKESCETHSSVYLTPKSSPIKVSEENQMPQDGSAHLKTMALNESHHSCTVMSDHSFTSQPPSTDSPKTKSSHKCGKTVAVHSYEMRTPSRLNGCMQDFTVADSTKRKSNQHRICQITSSQTVRTDNNSSVQPSSPADRMVVSSPSLPRPKIRKNSKPKPPVNSQPNSTMQQPAGPKPQSGRRKKAEPVQSTAITDYFPIRRSGRQTKSQIEKETQIHLEKLISVGCEDGLEVKEFDGKGRGVVATKMFDKGDYVVEYAGDLVDLETAKDREADYALTPSIGCYMYFFSHRNKHYCVDATSESGRLGRLINHSRNGNCGTKVVMVDGRPHLILVAARHIKEGEELSYDYGDRSKTALEAHPWLKL